MTTNLYITTAQFLTWQRSSSVDTSDDSVIGEIIEQVSRLIDSATGRHFYPQYQTRLYDIPSVNFSERDTLKLDDDLLSLTTLTNGNGTVITSTDYVIKDVNFTPYWAVKLRTTSSVSWEPTATGGGEQVLSIAGIWGYNPDYAKAWVQAGTLAAAISSTSALTATMTGGHTLASQQIWRIDDEILQGTVSTNALTFNQRGDNGSTAVTHLINTPVYVYQHVPNIQSAAQMITDDFYKRRFGTNSSGISSITSAGVVVMPTDIPSAAWRLLQPFVRLY